MYKRQFLTLPLLSLASVFAADTPESIGNDLQLFKDASCTALKQDVKDISAFQSDAVSYTHLDVYKRQH